METPIQLHNFATRPTLIRGAVDAWRPWIEAKIGVCLSEAVIIETSLNLAQIGVKKCPRGWSKSSCCHLRGAQIGDVPRLRRNPTCTAAIARHLQV